MTNKTKIYVAVIITLGTVFFLSTLKLVDSVDVYGVVIFSLIAVIAESLVIPASDGRALSVGFAIALTAILVFGMVEASWISVIGVTLRVIVHNGKKYHIFNSPLYRTLFNGANVILSTGLAGLAYIYLGGTPGHINLNASFIPIIVCILVSILVNASIMSMLLSLITGETFKNMWVKNIIWVIREYFAVAPLGIIMAIAYINYGILGVVLFFIPLLFARYSFKLYIEMRKIYIDTVKSLSQAMEAKDTYTQGHSMRVSEYACALAGEIGLPQRKLENLKIAAILHDIGKIGIEESILNKPGRLTDEEYDKIKQHPEIGVKIIQEIEFLKDASRIIMHHHERIDGTGYPQGIAGRDICLESCILSVADVYDALTSDRPYRPAMTEAEALNIIDKGKGNQFDARVADAFIKMMKKKRSE